MYFFPFTATAGCSFWSWCSFRNRRSYWTRTADTATRGARWKSTSCESGWPARASAFCCCIYCKFLWIQRSLECENVFWDSIIVNCFIETIWIYISLDLVIVNRQISCAWKRLVWLCAVAWKVSDSKICTCCVNLLFESSSAHVFTRAQFL